MFDALHKCSDNFGKLIKIMIFHCVWAMVNVDMGGVVCVQVHAKSRAGTGQGPMLRNGDAD